MAHENGISRRDWHRMAFGALAAVTGTVVGRSAGAARQQRPTAARIDSRVRGVQIGVQSYSFRDRPLDAAIAGMVAAGLGSCELWQGHVEPKNVSREELRQWRLSVPLDEFIKIKDRFDRAGIELYAYNISFQDSFTDAEIQHGFEMARALGVQVITASANQNTVSRVVPFAERFRMRVGVHNHSRISPNEFATPDDFTRAMSISPFIATNLDIGHFTAANFDAFAFLKEHHDRIVTLHIKDRKRDLGPNVPLGQGDTPIKAVLALLRDQRWPIPANIEYEYQGADSVDEVKACVAYCRAALES